MTTATRDFDMISFGCGPTNLSLSALLKGSTERRHHPRHLCLEQRGNFAWHSGQLFPEARMQSEFMRDLVTPVDPCSPYSFLSYLKKEGRLLRFLNSGVILPTRKEFTEYMRWVASELDNVVFDYRVEEVSYDPMERRFVVVASGPTGAARFFARHIVVGIGAEPYVPQQWGQPPASVFHVSEATSRMDNVRGSRVAVVGGGQSAAEVIIYLAYIGSAGPASVDWWLKDLLPRQLDTSHFTREFFTGSYVNRRTGFVASALDELISTEASAEFGISPSTMSELYELYYRAQIDSSRTLLNVIPATPVEAVDSAGGQLVRVAGTSWSTGETWTDTYDLVVACTGFRPRPLDPLAPLRKFGFDPGGDNHVRPDYSVDWGGPKDAKIFLQSRSANSHGVGDTALATVAERNAVIIKAAFGGQILPLDFDDALCWRRDSRRTSHVE